MTAVVTVDAADGLMLDATPAATPPPLIVSPRRGSHPQDAASREPSHEAAGGPQVIQPAAQAAAADDDEYANMCGVCFDEPAPGYIAKLQCCKNMLCLRDAMRVGACPFCRAEPLCWGLR